MNLSQLRSRVYQLAGEQSNSPILTTEAVTGHVNAAMHMIEAEQDWPWLTTSTTFTTENGTDTYGAPADWARTLFLRIVDQPPMTGVGIIELDEMWSYAAETGMPHWWAVEADRLVLRPTPDSTYTVQHRYVRTEPDLSSDGQSPLMPAKFHAAICELATWLALRSDREDVRGQAALSAYGQWQTKMRDDSRRSSSPTRVRVRPGGWGDLLG